MFVACMFIMATIFNAFGSTNVVESTIGSCNASVINQDGCCVTYLLTLNCSRANWIFYPDYSNQSYFYDGVNDGTPIELEYCFDTNGSYQAWFNASDGNPSTDSGNGNSFNVNITGCNEGCDACDLNLSNPYINDKSGLNVTFGINTGINDIYCTATNDVWDFDDIDDNNTTSGVHTFSSPGWYYVCNTQYATNNFSNETCEETKCKWFRIRRGLVSAVTIVKKTDINDIDIPKTIKVYPNPAQDFINVQGNIQTINILNIDGKTVISQNGKATSNNSINISTLPLGIYFLRTIDTEGNLQTKRFTKQ